ncbi:MAG: NAD(P)H-dependent oxidoreductase [Rhodospirillales bacterium]|nr:NAD(P)H-dependent oxidoreductase [Rhodospirillales bacterium]
MATLLGILGAPTREKSIAYSLLGRALRAAERLGVGTDIEILESDFNAHAVGERMVKANGLIIATPVHWFNVSTLIKRFLDEVFWELDGEPYPLEGKPLGIIATCNEDGANQAIASIAMPANHVGLYVPPFGTLIHNIAMPGHGEDGWQDDPEFIGRVIATHARQKRIRVA